MSGEKIWWKVITSISKTNSFSLLYSQWVESRENKGVLTAHNLFMCWR